MSLDPGTVTVADDTSVTGTGLARAIYDAIIAGTSPPIYSEGDPDPVDIIPLSMATQFKVAIRQMLVRAGLARRRDDAAIANAVASCVVAHIVANAVVTTTVAVGGLQKTPNPNDPDTATAAPASPVALTGAIT